MFIAGKTSNQAKKLIDVTYESMCEGIRAVKPGNKLGDIGHAIQKYAEGNYFSVVKEYCGHGIGEIYHDEPQILHYGIPDTGMELSPGMTFTIEPMVNLGAAGVRLSLPLGLGLGCGYGDGLGVGDALAVVLRFA